MFIKGLCIFIVLVSLTIGCSANTNIKTADNTPKTTSESNNNIENKRNLLQDHSNAASLFIENLGYKIGINSGVGIGIKLPIDFKYKKDSVEIGDFLYEKNQLSKEFGLDFSKYMGKGLYLLGYQISNNDISKGFIIMFFDNEKMVGAWIGDSNEEDLKTLMRNLETYSY